jgi:hypothetical protein
MQSFNCLTARRCAMGDKGGKKDKDKASKQKTKKEADKTKKKQEGKEDKKLFGK